jgi:hypothetical protein
MIFSRSYAAMFLDSARLRNNFAAEHISQFKTTLAGTTNLNIPDWMANQYRDLGVLDEILANPDPAKWSPELSDKVLSEPKKVMTDISGIKVYVIRKTVQEIMSKINIKEEKRFDYLSKAEDGNKIMVLDESRFFKYYKNGSRIVVVDITIEGDRAGYVMWNYELDSEYSSRKDNQAMAEAQNTFLQLMIFMEYAKHEEVFLKPSQKDGTRAQGKVLNDTKQNLIVVDSTWNKVIIRTEGFKVGEETGGFLAIRACGVGRYDRKLVWIRPFEKKGYTRGVKKDKAQEIKSEIQKA